MGLWHRAEGPLHFALRAGRGAAAIVPAGPRPLPRDPQSVQPLVKPVTTRHGTVIGLEGGRAAPKGEARVRLGGHGVEQNLQRDLHRFPSSAVLCLVRHPTAIIAHAKPHAGGRPCACVDPGWRLDLLEIRGADITLPQLLAVLGWETHRRRFPA